MRTLFGITAAIMKTGTEKKNTNRNENTIDINLFIIEFVIRFLLYLPGSSQTDDPGKNEKSL